MGLVHIPVVYSTNRGKSMIIKRAQFNFVDVFQEDMPGWSGHTRVKIIKTDKGKKAVHVSGLMLPKIRYVEIAKNV